MSSSLIVMSGTVNAATTALPKLVAESPGVIDPIDLVVAPSLLDSFTDALGSNPIATHTPSFNPLVTAWEVLAGGFNVIGGKAVPTSTSESIAVIDSGVFNCSVKGKVTLSNQDGLVFRATDNNNYFRAVGLVAGATPATRGWYLFRKQAGAVTQLAFFNDTTLALGQIRTMELTVNGTIVTLKADGVIVFTYSTLAFNLSATKYGMVKKDNGGSALNPVDDFQIGA